MAKRYEGPWDAAGFRQRSPVRQQPKISDKRIGAEWANAYEGQDAACAGCKYVWCTCFLICPKHHGDQRMPPLEMHARIKAGQPRCDMCAAEENEAREKLEAETKALKEKREKEDQAKREERFARIRGEQRMADEQAQQLISDVKLAALEFAGIVGATFSYNDEFMKLSLRIGGRTFDSYMRILELRRVGYAQAQHWFEQTGAAIEADRRRLLPNFYCGALARWKPAEGSGLFCPQCQTPRTDLARGCFLCGPTKPRTDNGLDYDSRDAARFERMMAAYVKVPPTKVNL